VRLVLIDTSAIYAIAVKTDRNHAPAVAFARRWLSGRAAFILPDWVFVETMTLLKARFGSEPAERVGAELRQNPAYRWMAVTPEDERESWAAFQKYSDKSWSYTDCAILVLAQRLHLKDVFAFDKRFSQMPGIVRRP
jgi:predicted nucleic acid-binding protein